MDKQKGKRKMSMPPHLVSAMADMKRMMDDPNIETGDDPVAFAREQFIPALQAEAQANPVGNGVEESRAVIEKYINYL